MGSCQLHQPMRIVTSFLRYDHVSNSCRLSPREEASRSPFQSFTLDRDGQIIRLEKERKDCLVKGQLDCVWRSAGGGGKEMRGWLVSWNKSQYHCSLSENCIGVLSGALIFFPERGFELYHTQKGSVPDQVCDNFSFQSYYSEHHIILIYTMMIAI